MNDIQSTDSTSINKSVLYMDIQIKNVFAVHHVIHLNMIESFSSFFLFFIVVYYSSMYNYSSGLSIILYSKPKYWY